MDGLYDRLLSWSLGWVYLWFGALKLLGMSPVLEFIRTATPPLSALPGYVALALFEVAAGVALLFGVWPRWTAAVVLLHLVGTFSVLLTSPQLAFLPQFPFLTMDGEFIVKNLVLVAAAAVLCLRAPRRRVVSKSAHAAAVLAFLALAAGLGFVGSSVHPSARAGAQRGHVRAEGASPVRMSTEAVDALVDDGRAILLSGVVVERCPFLGCWLKLRDEDGTLFVDLSRADPGATRIAVGSRVQVTGVIGKTREGKVGFIAKRVSPLTQGALQ